jgi:hypothetical protein
LRREPPKLVWEIAHNKLPGLAGWEVHRRGGRHLHELIGRRVAGLINVPVPTVFCADGLGSLPGLLIAVPVGEGRGEDADGVDTFCDGGLICFLLTSAASGRLGACPLGQESVHPGDFDKLKRGAGDGPGIVEVRDEVEKGDSVVDSEGDVWSDAPLNVVTREVVADD